MNPQLSQLGDTVFFALLTDAVGRSCRVNDAQQLALRCPDGTSQTLSPPGRGGMIADRTADDEKPAGDDDGTAKTAVDDRIVDLQFRKHCEYAIRRSIAVEIPGLSVQCEAKSRRGGEGGSTATGKVQEAGETLRAEGSQVDVHPSALQRRLEVPFVRLRSRELRRLLLPSRWRRRMPCHAATLAGAGGLMSSAREKGVGS